MSDEEKHEAKRFFVERNGIPGVIGCVDGSHIKILRPHLDPNLYYNRKGYFSINALIICDHRMMIRAVDATHPGSSHDALIWYMTAARSYLLAKFENGDRGSWLLGDAGFALEPFVLTPYKFARPGTMQSNFNMKHSSARNIVERTIGNLKTRFRCLLNTLYYESRRAVKIINVCCSLHNICKHFNLELDEDEYNQEDVDVDFDNKNDFNLSQDNANLEEGRRIRDSIAQSLRI